MKFCLAAVAVVLYAGLVGIVVAQQGNADEYIDTVLNNAKNDPEIRSKYEPLIIPDLSKGKGSLSEVRLHGLSSLTRSGPVTLLSEADRVVLEANLGLQNLRASTRWMYRAHRFIRVKGTLSAEISSISCKIRIVVAGLQARLETFRMTDVSGLRVTHFTGATVAFNWLIKWFINEVVRRQLGKIVDQVEKAGQNAIGKALSSADISKLIVPV